MTGHSSDEASVPTGPASLLPAVPPYQNGEDSSVGNRRFMQSDDCLEWRLAIAINTAIHFLDYHSPEHAVKILRDARADYLRMRK